MKAKKTKKKTARKVKAAPRMTARRVASAKRGASTRAAARRRRPTRDDRPVDLVPSSLGAAGGPHPKQVLVRFTTEEHAYLEQCANGVGVSVPAYVRVLVRSAAREHRELTLVDKGVRDG